MFSCKPDKITLPDKNKSAAGIIMSMEHIYDLSSCETDIVINDIPFWHSNQKWLPVHEN